MGNEMFVRSYILEYSEDGKRWMRYTDDEDYEQKVCGFTCVHLLLFFGVFTLTK